MRHDQSRRQILALLFLGVAAFLFVDLQPVESAIGSFLGRGAPTEAAPTVVEGASPRERLATAVLERGRVVHFLRGMIRRDPQLPSGWSLQDLEKLATPVVGARD